MLSSTDLKLVRIKRSYGSHIGKRFLHMVHYDKTCKLPFKKKKNIALFTTKAGTTKAMNCFTTHASVEGNEQWSYAIPPSHRIHRSRERGYTAVGM